MSRPAPKPPSALRPLQRKEGAASEQQPMPGMRLIAAVAAWIALSLAAGVATMIIGSEAAPRLTTSTLAVIIVTEVYVLLIVSLLAASGGWSAAVQTFGLRVQPRVVLVGVLLTGALSVAALGATPWSELGRRSSRSSSGSAATADGSDRWLPRPPR
jgi:hypothetical protein